MYTCQIYVGMHQVIWWSISSKTKWTVSSWVFLHGHAGRIQRAEEGSDLVRNGFTWSTSAVPSLGGISVALWTPSLSNPQHPPSLSLNHSDSAHLEPVCFSILSSTVLISNQPMGLSLSPHQQPALLVISAAKKGLYLEPRFSLRQSIPHKIHFSSIHGTN